MKKIWQIAGTVILALLLAAPLTMAAMDNLQVQQDIHVQLLPAKITFIHPANFKKEGWDSHKGNYKIEWQYNGGRDGKLLKDTLVRLDLLKADGTTSVRMIKDNLAIGNEGTVSGGGGTGSWRMDCTPYDVIRGDYRIQIQSKQFPDLIVISNVVHIEYLPW